MSHCEWKAIEEAPNFADGIYVWHDGMLVEAHWSKRHRSDELKWCEIERDRYGDEIRPFEPQPKYYLAVTPPPEG